MQSRAHVRMLAELGMEPAEGYERTVAGELIHIDVKKLGRIHGGSGKQASASPATSATPTRHTETARAANAR